MTRRNCMSGGLAAGRPLGVIGGVLIASWCSPVNAAANPAQPPNDQCRPATKLEYNSAKQQYLLRNGVGAYVRTGHLWRRYYWYCPL